MEFAILHSVWIRLRVRARAALEHLVELWQTSALCRFVLVGMVAKVLGGALDRATNLGGLRLPCPLQPRSQLQLPIGAGVPLKVSGVQLNGEHVIDILHPDNKDAKIVAHDAAQHVQVPCRSTAPHAPHTFACTIRRTCAHDLEHTIR